MRFGYTAFSHANDSDIKHLLSSFERFLSSSAGKEQHVSVVHILKWLGRYLLFTALKLFLLPHQLFLRKHKTLCFLLEFPAILYLNFATCARRFQGQPVTP